MSDLAGALGGTVEVGADATAAATLTADWLLERARTVLGHDPDRRFHVALSGGHTPATLYDLLASSPLRYRTDWRRWEVWFADERACPPEDAASNYRLAREHLLAHVPIEPMAVHRMRAEDPDLPAAAAAYAAELASRLPPGPGWAPRLAVVLLGLGTNGHTASLFPGEPVVEVTDRWVAPGRADYPPHDRLTLTLPTLNAAAGVAFTVVGADKGPALAAVAAGTAVAAHVRPRAGTLDWFLDAAAAEAMQAAARR